MQQGLDFTNCPAATWDSLKKNQTGVLRNVDTGGNEKYDVDQGDHGIDVGRELLREDLVVDEDGGDEGEDTAAQVPGQRYIQALLLLVGS